MANQNISEITTMPTNATIIKIINALIKRYNSLGNIYNYKGSVQTYADLLAIQNPIIGDVYNVVEEDEEHQIAAGSNFAWDGNVWDNLGSSLAGLVQSVNGITPDSLGAVVLQLIQSVSSANGVLTFTKNDKTTQNVDNIKQLYITPLGQTQDLNNLTTSGVYICKTNSYAANYENCPIQKAFLLEVQALNDGISNFVYQFLTQYNDGTSDASQQYVRSFYNNSWSDWRSVSDGSAIGSIDNIFPDSSGNFDMWAWLTRYANTEFANGLTTVEWIQKGIFGIMFNESNTFPNAPTPYGFLLNIPARKNDNIFQLYVALPKGDFYIRATNAQTELDTVEFIKIAFASDIPEKATQAEAEAGTNDTKIMTPLKVLQAMNAKRPLKTFVTFEQLGLTQEANTIYELCNALPNEAMFSDYISAANVENFGVPMNGILQIIRSSGNALIFLVSYGSDVFTNVQMWYTNWGLDSTELQWKSVATDTVYQLANEANLNNVIKPGFYASWTSTNAQTLVNNPLSDRETGIVLQVISHNGMNLQILYGTLVPAIYIRRRLQSPGVYNDWMEVGSGGVPVGTVVYIAKTTVPDGWLSCSGGAVSRTTYADLYAAIGTTFGAGDGSTTFNVPNLNESRFVECSTGVGKKRNAGLPDVQGSIGFRKYDAGGHSVYSATGGFSISDGTSGFNSLASYSSPYTLDTITFKASRSNGLYGDSSTVQPKALTLKAIIKY